MFNQRFMDNLSEIPEGISGKFLRKGEGRISMLKYKQLDISTSPVNIQEQYGNGDVKHLKQLP